MAYNIIPQRGVFSTIANLINENFQRIYQQILGLDGSGEQAAEDISQLESDVSALQSGKANDADVVHKAGAETITGNKTFTGTVKLPLQNSGILVTDENGVVQSDSIDFVADVTYEVGDNIFFLKKTVNGTKSNIVQVEVTPSSNSTGLVTSGGIYTALASKADKASPALTGTPTAPTAAAGTNTTQIATTAFVKSAVEDLSDTLTDGTAASESGNVIDVGEYDLMKIDEVKGKSLVMNQLGGDVTKNKTGNSFTKNGVTVTWQGQGQIKVEGEASATGTIYDWRIRYTFLNGHIYVYKIVTSGVVPNMLSATNSSVPIYDYFTRKSFGANQDPYWGVPVIKDVVYDGTIKILIYDITKMFGAGKEPTTVEEVEAILGNEYYECNIGEVVGNNVEKLDVTGFNIWDEEWEVGSYNAAGAKLIATDRIRCKNPIPVLPNTSYYFKFGVIFFYLFLDENQTGIVGLSSKNTDQAITSPSNAKYVVFYTAGAYGTTYKNDICINKSNTSKNGTYEPYKHSEFPLNLTELTGKVNGEGTSVTIFPDGLHGVGNVYDSLIVDEDGYARRAVKRMAKVDIGTFTWKTTSTESRFYASLPADATVYTAINNVFKNTYFCDKYTKSTTLTGMTDKTTFLGNSSYIYAQDSSYSTAADFKTAMDGVMLYYELATPIEYVLDTPVQCVAKVYPNGTVKQVPVMPDSTPMVMDVTYLRDNGGMIGGLMNRLDSLEPRIDDLAKGIKTISVQYGDATNIVLETEKINGKEGTVSIPAATSQAAGAMSAAQAALLEDLSDLADDIETLLASI